LTLSNTSSFLTWSPEMPSTCICVCQTPQTCKNRLWQFFSVNWRWKRSVGLIMWEMEMYCLDSRSRGISYMKYVNGRRTGLVTFCVEIAFYNGLLKERYKGG
jgi:hypothetical protein